MNRFLELVGVRRTPRSVGFAHLPLPALFALVVVAALVIGAMSQAPGFR